MSTTVQFNVDGAVGVVTLAKPPHNLIDERCWTGCSPVTSVPGPRQSGDLLQGQCVTSAPAPTSTD